MSPTILMAAERYLALGLSVIPLHGKIPAVTWSAYQRRKPSLLELRRWARRGLFGNVGVVCGEVSGSLVVLDFDDPALYDTFTARFPDLAKTYTVASGGGGCHVYLRADVLPPSRRSRGVELCAAGRQVAAPPSVHPSGAPYRVLRPLDVQHVPDLEEVARWIRPDTVTSRPGSSQLAAGVSLSLAAAIAQVLGGRGYRHKGDWLNGPCIYPERHAHLDHRPSFGFNTRTGYGHCFVCGSMLAKDIARDLGIDPSGCGGIVTYNRRKPDHVNQPKTGE